MRLLGIAGEYIPHNDQRHIIWRPRYPHATARAIGLAIRCTPRTTPQASQLRDAASIHGRGRPAKCQIDSRTRI